MVGVKVHASNHVQAIRVGKEAARVIGVQVQYGRALKKRIGLLPYMAIMYSRAIPPFPVVVGVKVQGSREAGKV
jgi:hypothetical protein